MRAEIIAIGTELTSGQSLDTNSQWLSQRLGMLGIPVRFHTTVGDDRDENIVAFRIAAERADLVITSGGLGPTQDDLTREVLAQLAGVELREDAESLRAIEALFARRNRVMTERNRVQALIPVGAEPLSNPIGTAPGILFPIDSALFAALPGVPVEMRRMFDEQVVPQLRRRGLVTRFIAHRKINLFGRGESEIEAQALDLTARGRVPEVGITASQTTIAFRIVGEGATEAEALAAVEPTAQIIYERFADLVIGEGDEDIPHAINRELARTGLTLSTAESCTGGMLSHLVTTVPGAGDHLRGGVVTYGSEAKSQLLGIPADLLASAGIVSAEVAEAMAARVRERLGADLGLSVTGFAGPELGPEARDGQTIGLVYVGLALPDGTTSHRRLDLGPEQPREIIQRRAAKMALDFARLALRRWPSPVQ